MSDQIEAPAPPATVPPAAAPPPRSALWPALAGGIVGALLTAALLLLAAPHWLSSKIVRSGMLADPQILVETADALRDRQYEPTLAANRAALETPFGSSWKGAAKPDVVMVEFFDYACPYCRTSLPHIERLIEEDKGLRVVFRELPILGPDSVAAARVSLAASRAGRFNQFHDALFAAGRPGPETIGVAARAAAIAPTPPADAAIEAELKRNFELASKLGATGTPLFIVGDRVINSAAGYEALKKAIADARAKG
ncbi:MAG: DsbA family protein [Sphingomicrobium sp.]